MLTRTAFWPEVRRAAAQWVGILVACVLSGSLLAILLHQGIGEKVAFGIAGSFGFLLALLLWVLITQRLSVVSVEYAVAVSQTSIQFEGSEDPTTAFAPVQISSFQPSVPLINVGFRYAPVA